ncbi:unnamed protein product [Moneuplotes crassus]|uniref:Uncharacterized protein n=1 Tax=Euplotes crassus TaxID=5936 RepID=A0AAD1XTH0_EUPCR|nr:unnamed protein product [Moneuplotes crassus]
MSSHPKSKIQRTINQKVKNLNYDKELRFSNRVRIHQPEMKVQQQVRVFSPNATLRNTYNDVDTQNFEHLTKRPKSKNKGKKVILNTNGSSVSARYRSRRIRAKSVVKEIPNISGNLIKNKIRRFTEYSIKPNLAKTCKRKFSQETTAAVRKETKALRNQKRRMKLINTTLTKRFKTPSNIDRRTPMLKELFQRGGSRMRRKSETRLNTRRKPIPNSTMTINASNLNQKQRNGQGNNMTVVIMALENTQQLLDVLGNITPAMRDMPNSTTSRENQSARIGKKCIKNMKSKVSNNKRDLQDKYHDSQKLAQKVKISNYSLMKNNVIHDLKIQSKCKGGNKTTTTPKRGSCERNQVGSATNKNENLPEKNQANTSLEREDLDPSAIQKKTEESGKRTCSITPNESEDKTKLKPLKIDNHIKLKNSSHQNFGNPRRIKISKISTARKKELKSRKEGSNPSKKECGSNMDVLSPHHTKTKPKKDINMSESIPLSSNKCSYETEQAKLTEKRFYIRPQSSELNQTTIKANSSLNVSFARIKFKKEKTSGRESDKTSKIFQQDLNQSCPGYSSSDRRNKIESKLQKFLIRRKKLDRIGIESDHVQQKNPCTPTQKDSGSALQKRRKLRRLNEDLQDSKLIIEVEESVEKSHDTRDSRQRVLQRGHHKARNNKIVTIEDELKATQDNCTDQEFDLIEKEERKEIASSDALQITENEDTDRLFVTSKVGLSMDKHQKLEKRKEIIFQSINESANSILPILDDQARNAPIEFHCRFTSENPILNNEDGDESKQATRNMQRKYKNSDIKQLIPYQDSVQDLVEIKDYNHDLSESIPNLIYDLSPQTIKEEPDPVISKHLAELETEAIKQRKFFNAKDLGAGF